MFESCRLQHTQKSCLVTANSMLAFANRAGVTFYTRWTKETTKGKHVTLVSPARHRSLPNNPKPNNIKRFSTSEIHFCQIKCEWRSYSSTLRTKRFIKSFFLLRLRMLKHLCTLFVVLKVLGEENAGQTLRSSLQISYLPLAAASWSGVNFHKSATLTEAPCLTSSSATS